RRGTDGSHAGEPSTGAADARATGTGGSEFMVGLRYRPLPRSKVDLLLALGRQPGFSELPDWMPARENGRGRHDQKLAPTRVGEKNRSPRARTLMRSSCAPRMTR